MRRFPVRWAVVTVVVLAIAGLGYWGVKSLSKDSGAGDLIMATKPVTKGDIEVTVRGWGTLEATEEQDVLSGAAGIVKDVFFRPGQQVSKGQVLATIDSGSLVVEIRKKEIKLELDRVNLAGAFGVAPDAVADVNPETALILRSPLTGRVTGLAVDAGSTAQVGKVCSVVDDRRLTIKMQVPKPILDVVAVGAKATFMPKRFDGIVEGVVTRADPTPIKGNEAYYFDVWVEFANPGLLRVGDEGALVFHAVSGDIAQNAKVSSYGSEETVNAAFTGRVKRVYVRDGMVVQKGDPILEFEAGEALLSAMTMQLDFKQNLITLDDLRSQLQNLSLVSPMDGVVLTRNVNPGQEINKGVIITRVSNFTRMNLMLRVDEMDIPKVQAGQQATIKVWGPEGQQSIPATVSELGVKGDPRDGLSSFNVTLTVQNPGFLMPGMGAEAQIFVSRKQNVLLCPVEALYKENDQWFVDVKDGKDRKPIQVQIGVMNGTSAEIVQGLSDGQEVVVGMTKREPQNQPGKGGSTGPIPVPGAGKVIR